MQVVPMRNMKQRYCYCLDLVNFLVSSAVVQERGMDRQNLREKQELLRMVNFHVLFVSSPTEE